MIDKWDDIGRSWFEKLFTCQSYDSYPYLYVGHMYALRIMHWQYHDIPSNTAKNNSATYMNLCHTKSFFSTNMNNERKDLILKMG